jgi:putative transposase
MPTIKRPDESWGSLEDVERWYRREKEMKLKQKLNAIRLLMKGRQRNEVADVLGVCEATVKKWRERWDKNGLEGLRAKHKGSKSKVTPDMRAEIEEIIEVKREIDGRTVTGKLIVGYIKKNTS